MAVRRLHTGRLSREELLRLLVRLLKRTPKLALRFVLIVISPGSHLKRLALVSALQLLASVVHYAQKVWTRGLIWKNQTFARQANALTYEDWRVATHELELERPRDADEALPEEQESFFDQLRERATNYAELRLAGDEYGLMFHLRSELMRQQLGNRGYSREGCVAARCGAGAATQLRQPSTRMCPAGACRRLPLYASQPVSSFSLVVP
jgi:TAG lipase/steryl ester hydrolase/phospholipase A2/LPA acyltransferase